MAKRSKKAAIRDHKDKGASREAAIGAGGVSKEVKNSTTIILPQVADITFAEEFKSQLARAVKSHAAITLDAAQVQKITSPCVQVIVSLSKSLSGNKGKLCVRNPSPVVEEAFTLLGLRQQLGQWREVHE